MRKGTRRQYRYKNTKKTPAAQKGENARPGQWTSLAGEARRCPFEHLQIGLVAGRRLYVNAHSEIKRRVRDISGSFAAFTASACFGAELGEFLSQRRIFQPPASRPRTMRALPARRRRWRRWRPGCLSHLHGVKATSSMAVEMFRRHRHAQHRQRGVRGDDAGEMRGAARAGDQHSCVLSRALTY